MHSNPSKKRISHTSKYIDKFTYRFSKLGGRFVRDHPELRRYTAMLDIRRQHVDLAFKKRDLVCIKLLWIFTYARVFERRLRIQISQNLFGVYACAGVHKFGH